MKKSLKNIKSNIVPVLAMLTVCLIFAAYIYKNYPHGNRETWTHDTAPAPLCETEQSTHEDTLFAMFTAFAIQESRCNPTAVSPCGNYVSYLQISKIMVREANRIIGEDLYTYDDRYDEGCSYGIFKAVQEHHNPTFDIDRAITIWNKYCPQSYRDNVKNNFQILIEQ